MSWMSAAAPSRPAYPGLSKAEAAWGMVAVLTVLGAYLRFANLGELGFRWDEDLSSLAVKAILEKGVPELPSGMIYLRGGPFLYAMAASAQLFGLSEFSLRLPAALFGVATIPLAFVFVRALFGTRVGLVAAGLLTISFWDVEFSRYARMYTPFGFFYLLTLYCLWRYRVRRESLAGGILCVFLAMVSISLHQLGYTLALAFLFPLVLRGRWLSNPAHVVFSAVSSVLVAGWFLLCNWALDHYRSLPILAADQGSASDSVVSITGSIAAVMNEAITSLLPDTPLVAGLWASAPALLLVLGAALLVATTRVAMRSATSIRDRLLLFVIAACCWLQLFNLALLGGVLLALSKKEGMGSIRRPDVRFAIALIGLSFAAWLALAFVLDLVGAAQPGSATALKQTARALLDFPRFFVFWGFVNQWPVIAVPALIGGLWAFDRAARQPMDRAAMFLFLALATPLIANGLFDTHYELFRYNVPFEPLYFTFAALGIAKVGAIVTAWQPMDGNRRLRRTATIAAVSILSLLVLTFDLNPLRGSLLTQRSYREDGVLYRLFGLARYPDYKTPADFVARSAAPQDAIVAFNGREYFNYIGRLDYWVQSSGYGTQTYDDAGTLRDLYVSTPLIADLDTLKDVLGAPGHTKWLIASDRWLSASRVVDEDIKHFVASHRDKIVYVGLDGSMSVYRFD